MLIWWGELILLVVGLIAGYVICFFMIRNNPKYLNVDKMIKEEIEKRRAEIIKSVQDKAKEIK